MEEDFATAMVAAFSQKSPLSLSYSFVNYFLKRRDYQTANKHKEKQPKGNKQTAENQQGGEPACFGPVLYQL